MCHGPAIARRNPMTRDEHLKFCKDRALEYLKSRDVVNAISSMMSDLEKHPETQNLNGTLASLGMMYAMNRDVEGARRFIEGFR
jgi:hypothetical protein